MKEKRLMTPYGVKKLQKELEVLKAQRPELATAIDTARALGDLSENADYHAAREKSGMVEAKIRDLESKLSNFEIINIEKLKNTEKVVFGSTVTIEDLDSGEIKKYSIYGDEESNPQKGIISYNTPIAKALFGKKVGDEVKINLPAGKKEYQITKLSVEYKESD